jgi:hypothetical protein
MKAKLKVAILLNRLSIPSWQYSIVSDIKNSDFADIVLVIMNNPDHSESGRHESSFGHSLIRLLDKTDKLIFKGKHEYDVKKNVSELVKDVPQLDVNGTNTLHSASFDNTLNEIRNHYPDIIIKFGFHILNENILRLPKYGIWTYTIDEYECTNQIAAGFWEVLNKYPVTNTSLVILNKDLAENNVLFSSWESTRPFSVNITRNKIFWRSSLFMPRIMNGLYRNGENYLSALKNRFKSVKPDKEPQLITLSFFTATRNILKYLSVAAKTVWQKIFYTDDFNWNLLYNISCDSNKHDLTNLGRFKKILSPKGFFWADPFIISENEYYYIFVEEFVYREYKAHLSVLKLDAEGNLLTSERIIERPYHMSYPCVFKVGPTYYMIPETSQNKTIELYKCTDFPNKWEFDRNIMENLSAVDSTTFYFDDKWWLFTSIDKTDDKVGASTELFLFFTENLLSGTWKSHPLNPVVSDERTARPAGKLFISEGKIFRPSQDCSVRYGRGFNLNEVTKLTETEYEETLFSRAEPSWDKNLKGSHTYNFDKDFTVLDIYSFRKRIRINLS